jgi:hypothetical protein
LQHNLPTAAYLLLLLLQLRSRQAWVLLQDLALLMDKVATLRKQQQQQQGRYSWQVWVWGILLLQWQWEA